MGIMDSFVHWSRHIYFFNMMLRFTLSTLEDFFPRMLITIWNIICSDLEVDYESEENASMVYAALAVDKEVILHDAQNNFLFFSLGQN
jgi:hypothetical protein